MKFEDIQIVSNRSAHGLWELTIHEFAKHLSKKDRKPFIENQQNNKARTFPSGETLPQLLSNVRRKNIHIIGAFHDKFLYEDRRAVMGSDLPLGTKARLVEERLLSLEADFRELEKTCDAARRAKANEISVYFTYYPDARQDKKDAPHVPISAKLTMDNIESSAGRKLESIALIDVHAGQTQGFTNVGVDEIKCANLFITHLKYKYGTLDDIVMIFPDGSSYTRFQSTVKHYNLKHLIINKKRTDAGESNIEYYQGVSPDGLVAVIFDDMIDSGGTTIEAGEEAYRLGAREVLSYATHFIASAKVVRDKKTQEFKRAEFTEDKFAISGIKVVSSDTIPRTQEYREEHRDWFTQFTIAPYLGDLIYCNVSGLPHNKFIQDYANIAKNGRDKDIRNEIERFFIY